MILVTYDPMEDILVAAAIFFPVDKKIWGDD
jgi:hypothetical protein